MDATTFVRITLDLLGLLSLSLENTFSKKSLNLNFIKISMKGRQAVIGVSVGTVGEGDPV